MTGPAVFLDLDFDQAAERSLAEGKLLVEATAAWCGASQFMNRTTWVDPDVAAWLAARAIAFQFDIDAHSELAKKLEIEVTPTIAFANGVEVGRVLGAKQPAELLAWLGDIVRGKPASAAEAMADSTDVRDRRDRAATLLCGRRYEEATPEYVWLWEHMAELEPAMYGVRHSFVVSELRQLATLYAPARDAICALRDRVVPPPDRMPERETFKDWVSLNQALGETSATLRWYDSVYSTLEHRDPLRIQGEIVPLLMVANRFADAGALLTNPLEWLARASRIRSHMLEHDTEDPEILGFAVTHFRQEAARLVCALVAANRHADAEAVATEARSIDPSDEMAAALDGS